MPRVVDTLLRWDIPLAHVEAFLASMAMDLTVTEYATWSDLDRYVYGSAAVIGLQMVPVLGPLDDAAYEHAQDLGVAFQLANFVRDVGEDLDRGRLYLPLEDLERFGLRRVDLERRVVDDRVRALLAFEVARVRRLAEQARPGIALLDPTSRPCIEAALTPVLRDRRRGRARWLRGLRQRAPACRCAAGSPSPDRPGSARSGPVGCPADRADQLPALTRGRRRRP